MRSESEAPQSQPTHIESSSPELAGESGLTQRSFLILTHRAWAALCLSHFLAPQSPAGIVRASQANSASCPSTAAQADRTPAGQPGLPSRGPSFACRSLRLKACLCGAHRPTGAHGRSRLCAHPAHLAAQQTLLERLPRRARFKALGMHQ